MGYKHDCEVQEFYQSYLAKKETILSKYFEKAQTLPKNIPCGETRFMIQVANHIISRLFHWFLGASGRDTHYLSRDKTGTPGFLRGCSCRFWYSTERFGHFLTIESSIFALETTFLGETFKTHRGFLRRYLSYRRRLLEIVSDFGKDKRFVVVGHSLGAAVATFASLELKNKGVLILSKLIFESLTFFKDTMCSVWLSRGPRLAMPALIRWRRGLTRQQSE